MSLFRATDILLIAVMVSAAAFTYKTKSAAEDQLAEVRQLERQIRLEDETIDLLKADWSLLTQPVRLQQLVEVYQAELSLQPVEAEQIVDPDDIPMKPLDEDESASPDDATLTGSTTR